MAESAGGTGTAHDASVKTESNVEKLERQLIEARQKAEREALVDNIANAKTKEEFHKEQAGAAAEAAKNAEEELKYFDEEAKKAAEAEAAAEAAAKEAAKKEDE